MDNRFYKSACPGAKARARAGRLRGRCGRSRFTFLRLALLAFAASDHLVLRRARVGLPRVVGGRLRDAAVRFWRDSAVRRGGAREGGDAEDGIVLRMSDSLKLDSAGQATKDRPLFVRADEIRGRPDLDVEAVGNAELRRSDIRIRADRLSYDQANDVARAIGNVRISHNGNRYSGPELQIRLETFEGFFMAPTFVLGRNRRRGLGGADGLPRCRSRHRQRGDLHQLPGGWLRRPGLAAQRRPDQARLRDQ